MTIPLQRLDDVDEAYINIPGEEVLSQHHHQADAANITLFEPFDSYRADADTYNRFERFDIEGDDDTQMNFTPREHSQVPTMLVPSPPPQEEDKQGPPSAANEIADHYQEPQEKQSFECREEAGQPQQNNHKQGPAKQRAKRKPPPFVIDYEQTIILGQVYQSWIQNPSDLVSRRGRKTRRANPISTMKTDNLMELPPVALITALSEGSREIHYPEHLLKLWMRCTQPLPSHDSQSGRSSPPQPPEASVSSPPERFIHHDPLGFPEDFHSGVGPQPWGGSIEKQRANFDNVEAPRQIFIEELRANLRKTGELNEANLMVTPGNSGDDVRSIPSSSSGHGFAHNLEVHSGRSNKKRLYSPSRHSGSSLEPVAEENPWQQPEPNYNLARLSENGPTPEKELLVETGPTQTQRPIVNPPIDKTTESILAHLKIHFDTPGAAQIESINQLAFGMNRRKAAQFFYHTCVLASHNLLKVEQKLAYGDILISKGAKM